MKPLHVLAVDPGTTRNGVAKITLLRTPLGGRFLYERGSHRELDRCWLHAELQQLREEGGIFAMEVLIGGRFKGRMTASLNETAQMQGRILDVAASVGFAPPRPEPLPMVEQGGVWTLLIPAGDGTIERVMGTEKVRSQKSGRLYERNVTQEVKINGWRGELGHTCRPSDKQIATVVTRIVDGIPHLHHIARPHILDALGLAIVGAHRHIGVPVRLSNEVEQALLLQQMADKAKPEKMPTRLYSKATRRQMGERARARST